MVRRQWRKIGIRWYAWTPFSCTFLISQLPCASHGNSRHQSLPRKCWIPLKEVTWLVILTFALDISPLNVHSFNYSMKFCSHVGELFSFAASKWTSTQLSEVFTGFWSYIWEKLKDYLLGCAIHVHVHVHILPPCCIVNKLLHGISSFFLVNDHARFINIPVLAKHPVHKSFCLPDILRFVTKDKRRLFVLIKLPFFLILYLFQIFFPLSFKEGKCGSWKLFGISGF